MADFLQTLIAAVTLGSLFALIALGYTMVYGVLKLINFAHSDIVVLGAWFSVTLAVVGLPQLGVDLARPPWWAGAAVLVGAMAICGIVGFLVERLAYKPIRKAPRLNALITAIGVSLLLQNAGQLQFTVSKAKETVAASGVVTERGANAKLIKLSMPVVLDTAGNFHVKLTPAPTAATTSPSAQIRKIKSAPGSYPAGAEITLDQPIGKTLAAANAVVIRESIPLKLPFGAMPARIPALLPEVDLVKLDFVSRLTQRDGVVVDVPKTVRFTLVDATILGTAAVLMVALQFLVFGTKTGTAMRAVSFNMETAALMGVPVNRIVSLTFVTGTALAAAAGFLYAMKYTQIQQPAHGTWVLLGLKAFVAAVVGGIGNIRGATVGGFLIAFIQEFGAYFGQQVGWDGASALTDVFVFALLIIVLLVKPTGIFGSTVREKV